MRLTQLRSCGQRGGGPHHARSDITILDAARATPPKGLVARMLDLGTLLDPRARELNKDMLAQLSVLIALGVASAQDRDAIKAWVEGNGDRDKARAVYDAGALSENQDARHVFDAGER